MRRASTVLMDFSIDINSLRATFGSQSPLTRAAEIMDANAPAPGRGDQVLSSVEAKLAYDPLFPHDLREAGGRLATGRLEAGSGAVVELVPNAPRIGGAYMRPELERHIIPQEVPVSVFANTPLEAAVRAAVAAQSRQDVLEKRTLAVLVHSELFNNAHPDALAKLRDHPAWNEQRIREPNPDYREVLLSDPRLTIEYRLYPQQVRAELVVKAAPDTALVANTMSSRSSDRVTHGSSFKNIKAYRTDASGMAIIDFPWRTDVQISLLGADQMVTARARVKAHGPY